MIVLDTNVVSELMRAEPTPTVLRWVDAQDAGQLWLTSVTVQELVYGIERLPVGKRQQELNAHLIKMLDDDFAGQVAPYDGEAAAIAGRLLARCEREGGKAVKEIGTGAGTQRLADHVVGALEAVRRADAAVGTDPGQGGDGEGEAEGGGGESVVAVHGGL